MQFLNSLRFRTVRLLKSRVFYAVLFIFAFVYINFHVGRYLFLHNHSTDVSSFEACPACFGQSACPEFFRGEITFKGIYRYPHLHRFNPRNVFEAYRGFYHMTRRVILKKLARDLEMADADSQLCTDSQYVNVQGRCVPRNALWTMLSDHQGASPLEAYNLVKQSPMTHCVTERLFERIKTNFKEKAFPNPPADTPDSAFVRHHHEVEEEDAASSSPHQHSPAKKPLLIHDAAMLIYNLKINQHALLLQTFQRGEGWPFPEYMGACGRFIMEEYRGESLDKLCEAMLHHHHSNSTSSKTSSSSSSEHATMPEERGLRIARGILQLADILERQSKKTGFALYLGPTQLEDLAVTESRQSHTPHHQKQPSHHQDDDQVTLIDLEDVVAVDLEKVAKDAQSSPIPAIPAIPANKNASPSDWLVAHSNPCVGGAMPKPGEPDYLKCSSAQPKHELCAASRSDHNWRSVCSLVLQAAPCLIRPAAASSIESTRKQLLSKLYSCATGLREVSASGSRQHSTETRADNQFYRAQQAHSAIQLIEKIHESLTGRRF